MSDAAGTPRSFSIEGIDFRLAADVNITKMLSRFENSMIATSGISMRKIVRRVPTGEGFVLIANGAEQENLKSWAESLDDLQFSYTTAGGDTYRTVGTFNIDNTETEENRCPIVVHPRDDWTAYID
jgi:hypothetical protein